MKRISFGLASVALLAATTVWAAQGPPTPQVEVVNTPTVIVGNPATAPVPVTVESLPSIDIGNSVLPVEVSNADPIPVTLGEEGTPFVHEFTCSQPGACAAFTLPSNQRLVIEQMTGTCNSTGPYLLQLGIRTVTGGTEEFHGLPPAWTLDTGSVSYGKLYSFGGLMRVYADAGASIKVNPNILTLNSGAYYCSAVISGLLITVP